MSLLTKPFFFRVIRSSVLSQVIPSRRVSSVVFSSVQTKNSFNLSSVSSRSFFSRSIMSAAAHPIAVGQKIPAGLKFQEKVPSQEKPGDVDADSFFKGRKIVIFAVPGAFTPGCSKTHLPGYVQDADKIKGKGVAEIACIATNDAWVMEAWGENQHATGKIRMLSDASGEFTKALGLPINTPGALTLRSQRYSAVVEDGVITQLNIDSGLSCSLSNNLKL